MEPLDRETALRLQKIMLTWDYASQETEMHRQRYLQLFTVLVTAGVASFVSVLLGGVPWPPGMAAAGLLMAGASLVHLRMRTLPERLRGSYLAGTEAIDNLIAKRGR